MRGGGVPAAALAAGLSSGTSVVAAADGGGASVLLFSGAGAFEWAAAIGFARDSDDRSGAYVRLGVRRAVNPGFCGSA